jgi:hypothetical protein
VRKVARDKLTSEPLIGNVQMRASTREKDVRDIIVNVERERGTDTVLDLLRRVGGIEVDATTVADLKPEYFGKVYIACAETLALTQQLVRDITDKGVVPADSPSIVQDQKPEAAKPRRAVTPKDEALFGFSATVLDLIRRTGGQKLKRFAATAVKADDLAKLGKFLTDLANLKTAAKDDGLRKRTAHHEAGHAVIGLAGGLPLAYATTTDNNGGVVSSGILRAGAVGHLFTSDGGLITRGKKVSRDAFGNVPKQLVWTDVERHAEVVMCIAGGMAEAKFAGEGCDLWRQRASSGDMSIARHHRKELGDKAKSWEQYAEECATLVNKHWPMVEAVAARLMKVDLLDAREIDHICQRVVRRQHLKSKSKGNA